MAKVIELDNVDKYYTTSRKNSIRVLNKLSLSVSQGDIFGFLGPNGAGKSTTIKILLNFISPDSGSVRLGGKLVGHQEHRNNVGYLSELPCYYPNLTAVETLKFSANLSGNYSSTFLEQRIDELLEKVNLSHAANQRISTFSKGMKQRIGLAVALIHDPDILILDEPMSGLDPVGRYLIKSIITNLREQNKTIFFSTHILTDIEELCNKIGIIHKGHLLYNGRFDDFKIEGSLEKTFVQMIEDWDSAKH